MIKKLTHHINDSTGMFCHLFYRGISFLVLCFILSCCFYTDDSGSTLTIMTYNARDFFDDVDNGTEYTEYDPGSGKWNTMLFTERLEKMVKVIKNAVPGGPDIIALQEIENPYALSHLCYPGLKGMGYGYVVMVPEPGSATNTGFISRIPIDCVRAYSLHPFEGQPLRKIVEAEFIYNGETLYVFNNHWKSKRGGAGDTEVARREAASLLITRINEIVKGDPYADIIVLGDLNENTGEYDETGGTFQTALVPSSMKDHTAYHLSSLFLSSDPGELSMGYGPCILFEPWYENSAGGEGSYVFHNQWQTPDHILLSYGLFHARGFIYENNSFVVINNSFLLDPVTAYPLPWDHTRGMKGYSDHLPLLLTIVLP